MESVMTLSLFESPPGAEEETLPSIATLIAENALFVCSHSGGKDSQAMLNHLLERIPRAQLVVVHATLDRIEWPGALEHAERQARSAELPFIVARANRDLLTMVYERFAKRPEVPSWPSAKHRQCTSDLKRGPIEREVRRYALQHGFRSIVMCIGIRAEESPQRAKHRELTRSAAASNSRRTWYEWLPVFRLTTAEVFMVIACNGQRAHYAYALGNQRLSCIVCIFGSRNDLRNGARYNPAVVAEYQAAEAHTGYTMHMSQRSLVDLVGAVGGGVPPSKEGFAETCSMRGLCNHQARPRNRRRHAEARARNKRARRAAAQ
jgi:3'-phosphoadenosine 5'-phosphosulfate sulfotransferase (PAPS reductase)/FAD synthetase